MAEFVMKDLVAKWTAQQGAAAPAAFVIDSAATSTDELGNEVYPATRRKLAEHGIGCAGKRARLMNRGDYDRYDYLIGMDSANRRNMTRICGGDPEGKIHLLLDFTGSGRDIADPWYTDDFDATWNDISAGCTALLAKLTKGEQS